MKIKLGVVFGGTSVEHEISIITAVQAMEYLNKEKYDIVPIYIGKDKTWYTGKMLMDMDIYSDFDNLKRYAKKCILLQKDGKAVLQSLGFFKNIITEIDLVFPIVHGSKVEDGTLAGYFETVGIPYVGSNILGSSLGQDKVVMKQIFESTKIPVVDYCWFYDHEYFLNSNELLKNIKKMGYPVVVKPASLGSSIGITFVKDETDIEEAINTAITYDSKIVVEAAVENLVEVNCSVIGNRTYQTVSKTAEMYSKSDILTYKDKYLGDAKKGANTGKGMASSAFRIPAQISDKLISEIEDLSKRVFKVLNLSGVVRIDFLIDSKSKKVYVNEPNIIPGSLAFYMWEPTGKPYTELLDEVITIAIKEYKEKNSKISSFDSNILSNFNGIKGFKGSKGKLKIGKRI